MEEPRPFTNQMLVLNFVMLVPAAILGAFLLDHSGSHDLGAYAVGIILGAAVTQLAYLTRDIVHRLVRRKQAQGAEK